MKAIAQLALCTLALTVLVAGCEDDDSDTADKPRRGFSQSTRNHVHGFAYADGPVSGARIRVYSTGGQLLADEPRETERGGTFFVRERDLPANYRVVATGGRHRGRPFKGELRAEVRRDDGAVIHLSPVSTITSDYMEQHRGAGLAKATDEVHEHLAIPKALDTEDLRVYDRYFDGKAFLTRAGGAGGVKAYAKRLAKRAAGDGPRVAFPRRASNAVGTFVLEYFATKALDAAWGQALSAIGVKDVTEQQLDEINKTLKQLDGDLSKIGITLSSVHAKLEQAEYDRSVKILPTAKIKHFNEQLLWMTTTRKLEDQQSIRKSLVGRNGYIPKDLQAVPTAFNEAFIDPPPGVSQLMAVYGEVVRAKSETSPIFTAADNALILRAYEYYDAYFLSAVNAVVMWRRATGADEVASLVIKKAKDDRSNHRKTAPSDMPEDGAVDTRTKLYWKAQGNSICGAFGGGSNDPSKRPAALNAGQPDPASRSLRPAGGGFKNWRLANADELQQLSGKKTFPPTWLRDHGFDDFPYAASHCGARFFLFSSEYEPKPSQSSGRPWKVGKRECPGEPDRLSRLPDKAAIHGPPLVAGLSGVGTIQCAFVGPSDAPLARKRPELQPGKRSGPSLVARELKQGERYW